MENGEEDVGEKGRDERCAKGHVEIPEAGERYAGVNAEWREEGEGRVVDVCAPADKTDADAAADTTAGHWTLSRAVLSSAPPRGFRLGPLLLCTTISRAL